MWREGCARWRLWPVPLITVEKECSRGGNEFERCTVDAVTEACGFRSVLEDVSLMAVAACAVYLGTRKNELEIGMRLDDFWIDRLPETRPACAAVKLMLG